jgi:hypothetical protein
MAVVAPMLGAPLLAMAPHRPARRPGVSAPRFSFCAALQAVSLYPAALHLRRHRARPRTISPSPP